MRPLRGLPVLLSALALAFAVAARPARSQEKSPPGSDVAPEGSHVPGVPAYPAANPHDTRARIFAPARVAIHEGARVGDWLERTIKRRAFIFRERLTIVGKAHDLWIVDRTGVAWGGKALRLHCAADGRVVAAAAGTPGAGDLVAIKVSAEATETDEAREEVETPAGKVHARKVSTKVGGSIPEETTRWIAVDGPLAGLDVKREEIKAGHHAVWTIAKLDEEKLPVGGEPRPCWKVLFALTRDGFTSGGIEEWLAKTPLFFGERIVRRRQGQLEEDVSQGGDGKPVFPLPAPR